MNSFNLPSGTLPYNFKSLEVGNLRPKHLMDFSEALVIESIAPVISAVGETIGEDVNALTFGDFYYVLAYHRFHSRGLPLVVNWDCSGTVYDAEDGTRYFDADLESMVNAYNADPDNNVDPNTVHVTAKLCNHVNAQSLKFEDFTIVRLDKLIDDPRFDFPRVKILADYTELQKNAKMANIARIAAWIKEGETIHDKIRILMDQDDFKLFDDAEKVSREYDHGISRVVRTTCVACGTAHEHYLSIGPQSFLTV